MIFYAHTGKLADKSDWQMLPDHLAEVARLAAENARPFGLERAAFIAGLFHDLGKYDPAFQRRLAGEEIRVDHSTAGAVVLTKLAADAARRKQASSEDALTAQLIAYCVLGHHAGLPDRSTADPGCFNLRFQRFADKLDPVWTSEVQAEVVGIAPRVFADLLSKRGPHLAFDLSVLARFLFASLVDADFKDTEAHYAKVEQRQVDRDWSALEDLLSDFTARFDTHMAKMPRDSDVNLLRKDILDHVRSKAAMTPGLFALTVPTGGGKTLASLGFALDHATIHGHRRIIYSIPFTSIIDQTADIFRAVLGEKHILEHHSAIDEEDAERRRRKGESPIRSRDRLKLAMQDWAAPVVVTTNVQLFESLFAARTSRARKLHNIAGSIIILDEAQTIPRHLLKPSVRMLDTLARLFGCTIVLCTATQPALGKERPDGGAGFPGGLDLAGRELAPDPENLAHKLRRARIARVGKMDDAALVGAIRGEDQALVIVNSRKHALELYRRAEEAGLDGLTHLTTRQCAAHRRLILADVRKRLSPEANKPCRVIATSLIEAGVDVDFPRVWRAEAGWDQIVQASGRCNRNGLRERDESIVTVFPPAEHEPPSEIKALVGDTVRALERHKDDIQSLDAIRSFFEEVYWRAGDALDREGIYAKFKVGNAGTDFAFREAAETFRMIESSMEPVIIPFDGKARKAVEDLAIEQIPSGKIARDLQSYIVQVPPKARELLIRYGHVEFVESRFRGDQFAVLKSDEFYTEDAGLLWENPEYLAMENSII